MNEFATSKNPDGRLPQIGSSSEAPFSLVAFLKIVETSVASIPRAWVAAEVISVKRTPGSLRFELAESDSRGSRIAKVDASLWRSLDRIVAEFRDATGDEPKAGMRLLARVKPTYKANFGFTLEIEAIDPSYTLGEIEKRRREHRERLIGSGFYELNKKFTCPEDFRRVAVVSPNEAAALGDFREVADKLEGAGLCRFLYHSASFQGKNSAETLCEAFKKIVRAHRIEPFCAVCIVRGGGSVRDLAELDHYQIVWTACQIPIPVLTGIGHERDNVLLDEVSNRRFDTPSKVALHIEKAIVDAARAADTDWQTIRSEARRALSNARRDIDALRETVTTRAIAQSTEARRALDGDYQTMTSAIDAALPRARTAQDAAWHSIAEDARRLMGDARRSISADMEQIVGLGPRHTLARGFAIVRDRGGKVITDASSASGVDEMTVEFRDGQLKTRRIAHGD